ATYQICFFYYVGPHPRHQRRLSISAKLKRQRYPKSLQSPGLQSTTTAMLYAYNHYYPSYSYAQVSYGAAIPPFYINHPIYHNLLPLSIQLLSERSH
ncbi:hypothetical protein M422DRAFT_36249, partial [Sphaerobolus stellatus SS14]